MITLGRVHTRRLRDFYRAASWPSQEKVEVELLAASLLEQVFSASGYDTVKLTGAAIDYLALAFYKNRQALQRLRPLLKLNFGHAP